MLTSARRLVLLVVLCFASAGAGSALFASPALAGGVDGVSGVMTAAVYNLTPYTMTLVAAQAPVTASDPIACGFASTCWFRLPDATIPPGGGSLWKVGSWVQQGSSSFCFGSYVFDFNAYFTYRIDVFDGPPEYQTVAISGAQTHGLCAGGDRNAEIDVFNTSAPPPPDYSPLARPSNTPPGLNSTVQVTYVHNVPTLFDQTFEMTEGHYTIDATTALGQAFGDALNALCSGAAGTSCSFTQVGPVQWGIGDPGSPYSGTNCRGTTGGQGGGSSATGGNEPSYFLVEYKASQSATLTVGGGITATAEFEIFKVVGNEVSVSVEAEHEWEEIKSLTRETKVFIPPGDIAFVWVVPTVAKVTGTLVFSNGPATFTAINFSETRSGVSRNALSPAYNVITKVRPMTAAEVQLHCTSSIPPTLLGASRGKPSLMLAPGKGVAKVALGQTRAQVQAQLGQPKSKQFLINPCQGLGPQCDASAGTGGRWRYRQLSAVFGPDLRVTGLIYSGTEKSAEGVGVGSSLAAVRVAYPRVSCSRQARAMDCTLTATAAGGPVNTVFRLVKTRAGRYTCRRVSIYLLFDAADQ